MLCSVFGAVLVVKQVVALEFQTQGRVILDKTKIPVIFFGNSIFYDDIFGETTKQLANDFNYFIFIFQRQIPNKLLIWE